MTFIKLTKKQQLHNYGLMQKKKKKKKAVQSDFAENPKPYDENCQFLRMMVVVVTSHCHSNKTGKLMLIIFVSF